jgi:hypothetical protein
MTKKNLQCAEEQLSWQPPTLTRLAGQFTRGGHQPGIRETLDDQSHSGLFTCDGN